MGSCPSGTTSALAASCGSRFPGENDKDLPNPEKARRAFALVRGVSEGTLVKSWRGTKNRLLLGTIESFAVWIN